MYRIHKRAGFTPLIPLFRGVGSQGKRGFTLIELLVVTSIIGLMSTTVLAALNSARVKAENSYRIQTVRQYKNAFDLSYDADGHYPGFGNPRTLNAGEYYCLGNYSSDTCRYDLWLRYEDPIINQALERFLSQRVIMKPIDIDLAEIDRWDSPIYICYDYTGGKCLNLVIEWVMMGANADCGFGITETPSSIGKKFTLIEHTVCMLYLL